MSTAGTGQPQKTPEERFREKIRVDAETGCHIWEGSKSGEGYPQFRLGDKVLGAHRLAYEWKHGPIPEETPIIRHVCHQPLCVNPEHLKPGTQQDNMDDMVRANRASRSSRRKLSSKDVVTIQGQRRFMQAPLKVLADAFGVTLSTIKAVVSERSHPNAADEEFDKQGWKPNCPPPPEASA